MSPQLREALRAAAAKAGCSVNAYAVQVLAAAAGDPARFRAPVMEPEETDVRDLERDALGFPLRSKERRHHSAARSEFMDAIMNQAPDEWVGLVRKYDAEDPGYYVEWQRRRRAEQQAAP
jgi:hypothetical protein